MINTIYGQTLFQIAEMYVGITQADILFHYPMSDGLREYLSTTEFWDVSWCYEVNKYMSLNDMFKLIIYKDTKKAQAEITKKLGAVKKAAGTPLVNSLLPSSSYDKSLHSFCPLYANLLNSTYNPYLLDFIAKIGISTVKEQLKLFEAFNMQVLGKQMTIATMKVDYYNIVVAAININKVLEEFYRSVNISQISSKLGKTRKEVLNLTLFDITAAYKNVSVILIHWMFRHYAKIPENVIRISSRMTMKNLLLSLNDSTLVDSSLDVIYFRMKKSGAHITKLGNQPLVVSAHKIGIIGIDQIVKSTLMQISLNVTNVSEEFLSLWFDIDAKSKGIMSSLISDVFSSNYSKISSVRLQHISIVLLSGTSLLEVNKTEKIQRAYIDGVKHVLVKVSLTMTQRMYGMNGTEMNTVSFKMLLNKYLGIHGSEFVMLFGNGGHDFLSKYPLGKLLNQHIVNGNMTIMQASQVWESVKKYTGNFFIFLYF